MARTDGSQNLEQLLKYATDDLATRESLLSRLRDWGDNRSWREFFDTYWHLIYGLAVKCGLTEAEAQDVVQETMISVAKQMPAFKYDPGLGSFKGWLLQITRRRIAFNLPESEARAETKRLLILIQENFGEKKDRINMCLLMCFGIRE